MTTFAEELLHLAKFTKQLTSELLLDGIKAMEPHEMAAVRLALRFEEQPPDFQMRAIGEKWTPARLAEEMK